MDFFSFLLQENIIMSATIIVDAFWGDAGKGKIAAYICQTYEAKLCIRAGVGTNAGHSIYTSDGIRIASRQLPLGWLNPNTQIRVGSGVVLNMSILFDEMEKWDLNLRTKVDFRCPIVTPEHIEQERMDDTMDFIDSTKTGSGCARADFIMRRAKQARDIPELKDYITDVALEANQSAKEHLVVIEGSQATFISLALSPDYPFTTSDNCTTAAFMDDVGLNWRYLDKVIMLVKCLPTRVGEGPLPNEMTWQEIDSKGLQEYGVVTGRPRRKAREIDWEKLQYATMLNGPTEIALTFCDHYDRNITGATSADKITPSIQSLVQKVEHVTDTPVTLLETGKIFPSIIDLRKEKIR